MNYRTDLAVEAHQLSGGSLKGVLTEHRSQESLQINTMKITTDEAAHRIGKTKGTYITIEGLPLTDHYREVKKQILIIAKELYQLLPGSGTVLVIGIGNANITPDAIGPMSAAMVLATRHIGGELAKSAGLEGLRPVAVLSPGVLGQTGIEVGEVILSLAESLSPSAVIAVDALASHSLSHLGKTIQMSDSGIDPGSGIGNHRLRLNSSTLGIPVIGIGMPTVVNGVTLAADLLGGDAGQQLIRSENDLMVTPKEIDLLTERASKLIGMAINCALQQNYSFEELAALVS